MIGCSIYKSNAYILHHRTHVTSFIDSFFFNFMHQTNPLIVNNSISKAVDINMLPDAMISQVISFLGV